GATGGNPAGPRAAASAVIGTVVVTRAAATVGTGPTATAGDIAVRVTALAGRRTGTGGATGRALATTRGATSGGATTRGATSGPAAISYPLSRRRRSPGTSWRA